MVGWINTSPHPVAVAMKVSFGIPSKKYINPAGACYWVGPSIR